jgi:outer membrane protein assembly factor BamB
LNPETGKLRWYAVHGLSGNVSPSVIPGVDTAFVFGGYPATRSTAIKLGGKGDITANAILWSSNTSSYVPTPILRDGHLYVVNDQGFATCIDAKNGQDVFRERVIESGGGGSGGGRRGGAGKPFYASPVLIGDKLICVSRKNGVYIIAAKPRFELLGHNVLSLDGSKFNATPAISGDHLLLRSEKAVYCIGAK